MRNTLYIFTWTIDTYTRYRYTYIPDTHIHKHTPLDEALSNKKLSFTSNNVCLMTIDDKKSTASIHVSGDGVEASTFTFLERAT